MFQPHWIVVLPPIIVFLAFFITKRIKLGLIIGLCAGSMIATGYKPLASGCMIGSHIAEQLVDPQKIAIYGFLFFIGVLVSLLMHTGGIATFTALLSSRIRSKRMVETTSLLLSHSLFLEDYLSSLTVGHVMRPLADKFAIPRAKLAFLVDAMAEPAAILMPISSWGAVLVTLLAESGISQTDGYTTMLIRADPMLAYVNAIPFIFYALFIIFSAWFIVRMKLSYGPMRRYEHAATLAAEVAIQEHDHHPLNVGSLHDLLLPLFTLIGGAVVGFAYSGGYWLFGGTRNLFDALRHNNHTSFILFVAVVSACIVALIRALVQRQLDWPLLKEIARNGIAIMTDPLIILVLASSLGSIFKDELKIGEYLATLLHHSFSISFLPCIFFLFALIAAMATCGSWSALPLVLPIALPMAVRFADLTSPTSPEALSILSPLLGAIFSGVLAGDHLSPISDTTLMASIGSGAQLLDHFYTQLFYVLPAVIASACAFLVAGMLHTQAAWIMLLGSLGCGLAVCIVLIAVCGASGRARSGK